MAKTKPETDAPDAEYVVVRGFSTATIFHREAGETVKASECEPDVLASLIADGIVVPAEEN